MLSIILLQDFCPLKIKITQCPSGFRLNFLSAYCRIHGTCVSMEVT